MLALSAKDKRAAVQKQFIYYAKEVSHYTLSNEDNGDIGICEIFWEAQHQLPRHIRYYCETRAHGATTEAFRITTHPRTGNKKDGVAPSRHPLELCHWSFLISCHDVYWDLARDELSVFIINLSCWLQSLTWLHPCGGLYRWHCRDPGNQPSYRGVHGTRGTAATCVVSGVYYFSLVRTKLKNGRQ